MAAADDRPGPVVGGAPARPADDVLVFVLDPVNAGVGAEALCRRLCRLMEGTRTALVVCDVTALDDADAGVVDVLARLQLSARRRGALIRLRGARPALRELLALAGLCQAVPLEDVSPSPRTIAARSAGEPPGTAAQLAARHCIHE